MLERRASESALNDLLTRLFASEYRTLIKIAARITRDGDDAADAVQVGFVRARECAHSLIPEHASRWLRVVVRRVAVDIVRARAKLQTSDLLDHLPSAAANEPEPQWLAYDFDELERVLRSCPEPIRCAFRMWWCGVSYEEMAKTLAVPTATVATRVFRAKSRLRNYYRASTAQE
jgi:RNA polymerase sigma factor (sigma-70 family)